MDFARMWAMLRISLNDRQSWDRCEVKALMEQIEQEELSIMLAGTPNIKIEPTINIEKVAKEISDMVLRTKGGL